MGRGAAASRYGQRWGRSMMSMGRVSKAIRRRFHVPVLSDEPPDYRAAVFVAGSGRSGTSWLAELLLHGTRRRYVFEPLSPNVFTRFQETKGSAKPYLRPDDYLPNEHPYIHNVLCGFTRSAWTERHNRRLWCEGRVVKEIRANLMLGWIQRHFPGMPVVLVLRHPMAVAASAVREGWAQRLDKLVQQEKLLEDYPVIAEMPATTSAFERAVAIWCIETMVALRQLRAGSYIVCYEQLMRDPARELTGLYRWLGRSDVEGAIRRATRDSLTTRAGRSELVRLGGWRSELSPFQVQRALALVRHFGLDGLYGEGVFPKTRVPLNGTWERVVSA